jgi:NADPH-dependent 2,4-dienoyl-CoA reductase/sulfur reductase-like enzyme/rhodanese-related sulfurtransferase
MGAGDDASSPEGPPVRDETIRLLSHELKSPINAIRSLLDAITQGLPGELPPHVALLVERAAKRADEARELVSDLLEYEGFGGRPELRKEEFDAVALAGEAAASLQADALDKEVDLDAELPEGVAVLVLGDRRALGRALRNLVENAVKYTPARGSVTVGVRTTDEPPRVSIRVSDTGSGIPEDEMPRLFEPFFRSALHRRSVPGTGLGLAIARRIVTAHGGTLAAESRLGAGSAFTVTLPFERVQTLAEPTKKRRRVLIVGGVTAGPKVAARLRRLDAEAEITLIEKSEFLSYTGCGLPDYVSGRLESPRPLMSTADNSLRTARFFRTVKDVRVMAKTLATRIDRTARVLHCRDVTDDRSFTLPYDVLVLATGSRPLLPPVPGIDLEGIYSLYSLEAARELRARLASRGSLDAFVVGAGYIGVSLAESLVAAGARVTLLERDPAILGRTFDADMAGRIQDELARRGVKVLTSQVLTAVRRDGDRLRLETTDRQHAADFAVLSTGVTPDSALASEAGLATGPTGAIRVNPRLQTSDPSIYAVGDCAEAVHLVSGRPESPPLGSMSTKMGRLAADAIAGRDVAFRGSVGTALLRVFDLNAGRCGLTHEVALERGFEAVSTVVCGLDRPHYEPGAARVCLKVTAEGRTGRLLGAQGIGAGDVVSRIRILAAAITGGLTLREASELDLGYAPAFTTVVDVAQTACLVLQNKLDGLVRTVTALELGRAAPRPRVVDVSPYADFARRSIPGSVNVPLENLRDQLIPFDRREQVVLCDGTSSGAYEAYRILVARGWTDLRVLEGGTADWHP